MLNCVRRMYEFARMELQIIVIQEISRSDKNTFLASHNEICLFLFWHSHEKNLVATKSDYYSLALF